MAKQNSTKGIQKRAKKGTPTGGQWAKADVPASVAWNKAAKGAYLKTRKATSLRIKAYKTKKKLDAAEIGTTAHATLVQQYHADSKAAANAKKNAALARKVAGHHGFKISATGKILSTQPLPDKSTTPLAAIKEKVVPTDGENSPGFGRMKISPKKPLGKMTKAEFRQTLVDSPVTNLLKNLDKFSEYGGFSDEDTRAEVTRNVHDALGFTGKPKVVDKLDDVGDPMQSVVYRGVDGGTIKNSNKLFTSFRDGKMYMGKGIYGNGTYTTTSYNAAFSYAGGFGDGAVMKIGVPKSYRVVKWGDLSKKLGKLSSDGTGVYKKVIKGYMRYPELAAMALGYDGIEITQKHRSVSMADSGGDYYNIFNRADLYMEKNKYVEH